MRMPTKGNSAVPLGKWREESNTPRIDNYYLEIQRRVHRRLNAGVTTKASRTPGGPSDTVDPAELTRVELRGVDAIDKRTQTTSLYNLRINGSEYVESLAAAAIGVAGAASSRTPTEIHEHSSQVLERWDCTGDPLPTLIEWARSRWGDDLQKLPSRPELLRIFREQFGPIPGINEKTMREVRRQLAPEKARRGGAPTHRR